VLRCPRRPLTRPPAIREPGIASPGVLAPSNTLRRVPFDASCNESPSCTLRVRIARPSPVPSSGFLPLSTVVLATHAARAYSSRSLPFAVAPRRFAALFHAARVPGVALQSLPFSRSRARSHGPFLPCGFAFDRPTARCTRGFRGHFPRRADPLPRLTRRLAGRMGQDDGSSWSLGGARCALSRVHGTISLVCTGLACTAAGTPASKLCSPRESVHLAITPWPGHERLVGALLGLFTL